MRLARNEKAAGCLAAVGLMAAIAALAFVFADEMTNRQERKVEAARIQREAGEAAFLRAIRDACQIARQR